MLRFDAEKHLYWLDGKLVPSVTQVTAPLVDYSGVPDGVLEHKRQLGTALHKAIELHLADDLVLHSVDRSVLPYFQAFLNFQYDTGFQARNSEYRVASKQYGFAGTLDLDGWQKHRLAVIDYKTTYTLSPAVAIQTAGYLQAANESGEEKILDRYALHLKPDGTYRFEPFKDRMDFEVFKSLLNIINWQRKNNGTKPDLQTA